MAEAVEEEELELEEMDEQEEDDRVLYGSDGEGDSNIGHYAASEAEHEHDDDKDALSASLVTAAAATSPPNDQRSNGRGEDWLLRSLRAAPSTPPHHHAQQTITMKQPTPARLRLSDSRALSFSPGSPHSIELDNESAFLTPKAAARRVFVDEDTRGLSASLSTLSNFWSNNKDSAESPVNNNSKDYASVKYDAVGSAGENPVKAASGLPSPEPPAPSAESSAIMRNNGVSRVKHVKALDDLRAYYEAELAKERERFARSSNSGELSSAREVVELRRRVADALLAVKAAEQDRLHLMTAHKAQLASLHEAVAAANARADASAANTPELANAAKDLQRRLEVREGELEASLRRESAVRDENGRLREALIRLSADLQDTRVKRQEWEERCEQEHKRAEAEQQTVWQMGVDLEVLKKENMELDNKLSHADTQILDLRNQVALVNEELAKTKKLQRQLVADMDALHSERRVLRAQVDTSSDTIASMRAELSQSRSDLADRRASSKRTSTGQSQAKSTSAELDRGVAYMPERRVQPAAASLSRHAEPVSWHYTTTDPGSPVSSVEVDERQPQVIYDDVQEELPWPVRYGQAGSYGSQSRGDPATRPMINTDQAGAPLRRSVSELPPKQATSSQLQERERAEYLTGQDLRALKQMVEMYQRQESGSTAASSHNHHPPFPARSSHSPDHQWQREQPQEHRQESVYASSQAKPSSSSIDMNTPSLRPTAGPAEASSMYSGNLTPCSASASTASTSAAAEQQQQQSAARLGLQRLRLSSAAPFATDAIQAHIRKTDEMERALAKLSQERSLLESEYRRMPSTTQGRTLRDRARRTAIEERLEQIDKEISRSRKALRELHALP